MQVLRWSEQGWGERVLRVWLGGTFVYAGVQKLTDPGFLTEGSGTFIGSQLEGYAQISPLEPLLELLADIPTLAGVGVALTEILIGLATLAGVAPAIAALGGLGLSVTLWLTATWSVYPYFLGSDTIYAVAWLAYLLGLPSTRAVITRAGARTGRGGAPGGGRDAETSTPLVRPDRRGVLRGGAVVVGGLALGGAAAAVGAARRDDSTATASGTSAPTTSATADADSTEGAALTTLAALGQQGSVEFDDPAEGTSVVVPVGDTALAYSLRCTHSGCIARFDTESALIACPCHASRFDPADGGRPVSGPATRPLTAIPVEVDPADGTVRRA